MQKTASSLLAVVGALALATSLGRAQIVIPDINKDTLKTVPPPVPLTRQNNADTDVRPAAQPTTPDPRCARLPETLRRNTPGCQ